MRSKTVEAIIVVKILITIFLSNEELQENLSRIQPDFLVIGDEVVIDLKTDDNLYMLGDIKIAC